MTSRLSDIQTISPSKTSRYRPEIDGLRAFAVVAVIINHFNKDILPGGYLGVDIFFVISGYVITSSLFGRPSKDFKDFISGFYERRIKRLVPALSVFVLAMSIAICLFNPSPGLSLRTGLTSLFGLSNLYLLRQSTDYFAQSTELNVFSHTWSLGVEEQFYVLFPFIIWFSGFGSQAKNGARNLFLVVGTLTIASLIAFLYFYPINQPAAYFLMPSRFWEMAAGCLIFLLFQKRASVEYSLERVPPLLVLTLIICVMYLPMSFAAVSTVAVVILSSILIACLKNQTAAFKVFTNTKIVHIGLISYSLYLWHWGVLSISRWTIGIHWWSVPLQVALIYFLALISYRAIETPFRRKSWFKKRSQTLLLGGIMLGASSLIPFQLSKVPYLRASLFMASSKDLTTTWWADENHNYIEKCHVKKKFSKLLLSECIFSPKRSLDIPAVYLIGDSHARNYLSAIRTALPAYDVRYMTMGHGCAFLPSNMLAKTLINQTECSRYVDSISKMIVDNAVPGDIVFIGQSLIGANYLSRASNSYFEHIRNFANHLHPKSVPVVILDGTYPPSKRPELCTKELWRPFPRRRNCEKSLSDSIAAYAKFDKLASALSKSSANILYMPLRFGLCFNQDCGQYTKKGTQIWHDYGHITESSSAELADLIKHYFADYGFALRL